LTKEHFPHSENGFGAPYLNSRYSLIPFPFFW
jgi:hypothetical protein